MRCNSCQMHRLSNCDQSRYGGLRKWATKCVRARLSDRPAEGCAKVSRKTREVSQMCVSVLPLPPFLWKVHPCTSTGACVSSAFKSLVVNQHNFSQMARRGTNPKDGKKTNPVLFKRRILQALTLIEFDHYPPNKFVCFSLSILYTFILDILYAGHMITLYTFNTNSCLQMLIFLNCFFVGLLVNK